MNFDKWDYLKDFVNYGRQYEKLTSDERKAYQIVFKKMLAAEEIEKRFEDGESSECT